MLPISSWPNSNFTDNQCRLWYASRMRNGRITYTSGTPSGCAASNTSIVPVNPCHPVFSKRVNCSRCTAFHDTRRQDLPDDGIGDGALHPPNQSPSGICQTQKNLLRQNRTENSTVTPTISLMIEFDGPHHTRFLLRFGPTY